MFVEGQKRKNNEIDELKQELHNLRKDYDVEIKAMFLDLNRVKEELFTMTTKINESPLHANRQNSNFEMKPPNARYKGNKKDELQYVEGNNSSIGSSMFEYSSRSRIYGD